MRHTNTLLTKARPAGFRRDLLTVAGRALRAILREPENIIPALVVPVFFFFVNIGSLEKAGAYTGIADYKAFQLPVAIIFAVTGVSRAVALVTDITSGYFDRLLVSPVNRWSLILGLMMADLALIIVLCIPVLLLAMLLGVQIVTGPLGILAFLLLSGLWGLVFAGFPYTIALRTGSPTAVNTSFLLFLPFVFLTTAFMPQEALTGWMGTVATYNPVTYMLAGLRALVSGGWILKDILAALGVVLLVGTISFGLTFSALHHRVKGS